MSQVEDEKPTIPLSPEALQALVEILYPEPGVVDILTLDQFIFRYKFSGLGATAVADMERAQRITRSIGDHEQIGLAEFHIGLIYLHWGQFLGAIKYFDDAHRHWQFAKKDGAVSLAQFAQGVCQHHAYHYENALANYGKVQRILSKIEANGSQPTPDFLEALKPALSGCREDVVQKIRTLGEGEPVAFRVPLTEMPDSSTETSVDGEPLANQTTKAMPTDSPASEVVPSSETASRVPAAPMPISNLPRVAPPHVVGAADEADTQSDQESSTEELAVPPAMLTQSPIPNHTNQSDDFVWYHVADREDLEDFLPDIQADTALLVDTRTDLYTCAEGDLVIVDQADAEGSIPLRPQQSAETTPFTRIYLAEVDEQFSFTRDHETGEIRFKPDHPEEVGKVKITANQADFPIYAEEIIGIVIGIWSKLHPAQR